MHLGVLELKGGIQGVSYIFHGSGSDIDLAKRVIRVGLVLGWVSLGSRGIWLTSSGFGKGMGRVIWVESVLPSLVWYLWEALLLNV